MCVFIDTCPAGAACKCALNLPLELRPWPNSKGPQNTNERPKPAPDALPPFMERGSGSDDHPGDFHWPDPSL